MKYLLAIISIITVIIPFQNKSMMYGSRLGTKQQFKNSSKLQYVDTSYIKDQMFLTFLRHFKRKPLPFSTISDTLSESLQLSFYKHSQIPKNFAERFLCNGNPQCMIVNKRYNIYYDFYYKYIFPSNGDFITLLYEVLDGEGGRDVLATFGVDGKLIDSAEIENLYTDETSPKSYFYKDGEVNGSVINTSETFIKLNHKVDADTVKGFIITETLNIENNGHIKKIKHNQSGIITFKFVNQAKFEELDDNK